MQAMKYVGEPKYIFIIFSLAKNMSLDPRTLYLGRAFELSFEHDRVVACSRLSWLPVVCHWAHIGNLSSCPSGITSSHASYFDLSLSRFNESSRNSRSSIAAPHEQVPPAATSRSAARAPRTRRGRASASRCPARGPAVSQGSPGGGCWIGR